MADAWGVESRYVDVDGNEQTVPANTIERLHAVLGDPDAGSRPLVVREGDARAAVGAGELELETGEVVAVDELLPAAMPFGYHTFHGRNGDTRTVIATPGRCFFPPGWRAFGLAAQLYATRSAASWGIGDLGDLARLSAWAGERGAGFVLVNPLSAVASVGAQQPSPYFPASRRFHNPIYLRVEDVSGAANAAAAVARAAQAGTTLNAQRVIDRDSVWANKRAALEVIWESRPPLEEFDRWFDAERGSLQQFATWCAITERHGPNWRAWPADLRRPDCEGTSAYAAANRDRIRFHAWLQWLLQAQLKAAAAPTALLQDLPIGVDPDGFDAWEWQDILAANTRVGAPPDDFNRSGQDWGLPPFVPSKLAAADYRPFIETIRASMAAGGGVRVDHVMGLFRLWWIPSGCGPAEGAYVRYPADDLLGIVALESHRAGAFVVGEDLGTVEDSARAALAEHNLLSYRLLWFEADDPSGWPSRALAAVTTHDLPTVVGLWDGSDLDAQRRAGMEPNAAGTAAMRDRVVRATGLDVGAPADDVVVAAYRSLARAPSVLLALTLDDAVGEAERPNIPGADGNRPNWSLALPLALEAIESHPLAARLTALLNEAVQGRPPAP